MDDQENHIHRSNLHIVGLPEDMEGSFPETFAEETLIQLLGHQTFSSALVVERAHRILPRKPPPVVHFFVLRGKKVHSPLKMLRCTFTQIILLKSSVNYLCFRM